MKIHKDEIKQRLNYNRASTNRTAGHLLSHHVRSRGRDRPTIVRGIPDNLKGRLPFFLFLISLIPNLITVILIILYYE